jgi:hypothetical protein
MHLSLANLTLYQKVVLYAEIMIYNPWLSVINNLSDDGKQLKTALRRSLWTIPSIA